MKNGKWLAILLAIIFILGFTQSAMAEGENPDCTVTNFQGNISVKNVSDTKAAIQVKPSWDFGPEVVLVYWKFAGDNPPDDYERGTPPIPPKPGYEVPRKSEAQALPIVFEVWENGSMCFRTKEFAGIDPIPTDPPVSADTPCPIDTPPEPCDCEQLKPALTIESVKNISDSRTDVTISGNWGACGPEKTTFRFGTPNDHNFYGTRELARGEKFTWTFDRGWESDYKVRIEVVLSESCGDSKTVTIPKHHYPTSTPTATRTCKPPTATPTKPTPTDKPTATSTETEQPPTDTPVPTDTPTEPPATTEPPTVTATVTPTITPTGIVTPEPTDKPLAKTGGQSSQSNFLWLYALLGLGAFGTGSWWYFRRKAKAKS